MGAVASVMNDKNKKKFPKNMTEEVWKIIRLCFLCEK